MTYRIKNRDRMPYEATLIKYYRGVMQRVRRLHSPVTEHDGWVLCTHCRHIYPCPTVDALDGGA